MGLFLTIRDFIWWAIMTVLFVVFVGAMGYGLVTGEYVTAFLIVVAIAGVLQVIKPGRWIW